MKELYQGRVSKRVAPEHIRKLSRILSFLDQAEVPADMDIPGFRLHRLKGKLKGHYSFWVSGNWRVTVRFEGIDAADVDYVDYH